MENSKEKEWDEFLKKTVKQAGLESPSPNFTNTVLSRIEAQKRGAVGYTPLISRTAWSIMGLLVLVFFGFAIWGDSEMEVPRWVPFDMEGLLNERVIEKFQMLQLSNTVLYGVMALAFFITIQVILLKNQVNRRFAAY